MDKGKAMGQWAYYGLSTQKDEKTAALLQVEFIEKELMKRIEEEPFAPWGRKQENSWDRRTNFIYKVSTWEGFKKATINFQLPIRNYALNRWFNFWSANGIENIFCSLPGVKPHLSKYDKLVDFKINSIPFDHKTTVFPKRYNKGFAHSLSYPESLAKWLYENQSKQQRYHLGNRLFVVLYAKNGEHWKLRARLTDIHKIIKDYVETFDEKSLIRFSIQDTQWVII